MARGATSFTVFMCLLFLFAFSSARIPVDHPEFDDAAIANNHEYDAFSESRAHPNPGAAANTLFLPSENPDTEPMTVIQLEPETTDSKLSKPELETVQSQLQASTESQSQISASDPDQGTLTVISFRPMKRHVPRRPLPLSYRFGHRCRLNYRFKPRDPFFPRRHIPYGNDMIVNNGEARSFDRVRQFPPRWMRFHHVRPRFSREHNVERSEETRSEEIRRPHHHHHHHHMDKERKSGFMMRFRKFLNQF